MKIELRNVKYAAFASEETSCFNATVYIDGVKAGEVSNRGHGGPDDFHPYELQERLDAYGKTLPMRDIGAALGMESMEVPADAESLVGELLTTWLIERDFKRSIAKRVLFTKKGKKGIFQSGATKNKDALADLVAKAATIFKDVDVVLNTLPLDKAVAIYRSQA